MAVSVVVDDPPGLTGGDLLLHLLRRLALHRPKDALDHLVDADAGGIDADRVVRSLQRGHRAIGIAGVTGQDLP